MLRLLCAATLAGITISRAFAQMAHDHKEVETCTRLSPACANSVSPAFAPDGTLWIAARAGNRIFVDFATKIRRPARAAIHNVPSGAKAGLATGSSWRNPPITAALSVSQGSS